MNMEMKKAGHIIINDSGDESGRSALTRFDTGRLLDFVDSFYGATEIAVSVHTFVSHSVELQSLNAGTTTDRSFCALCRQPCFNGFRRACFDQNREMLDKCRESRNTVVYRCHMGLLEAIIPFFSVADEMSVIYLGRVDDMPVSPERFGKLLRHAEMLEPGITGRAGLSRLEALYYSMPRMTEEKFRSNVRLAALYAETLGGESGAVRYAPQNYAESLRQFLRANAHRPVSRTLAARHLGISEGYLSHIISKELGVSFSSVITQSRMELAEKLLTTTPLPIKTVASECGFENPKYFSSVFRRYHGITAAEYRRKEKESAKT